MRRLQNKVARSIYEGLFTASILAPEHEDHMRATLGDDLNHPVREDFPAFSSVGGGFMGFYGEDGIEKEDALLRPRGKIATGRHRNPQVLMKLMEDILQRGWKGHTGWHGKAQPMGLPGTMIRVLPQYHHLHLRKRT